MPTYEFRCNACEMIFETSLPMKDYLLPESEPCPDCGKIELRSYLSTAPALGDPVKLGFTRPPDAWMHGILGKMQESVPTGGMMRDSRGNLVHGQDGRPKMKKVSFSNCRYSPNRLV